MKRVKRDILHFFLVSIKSAAGYARLFNSVEKKKKRKILGMPFHISTNDCNEQVHVAAVSGS